MPLLTIPNPILCPDGTIKLSLPKNEGALQHLWGSRQDAVRLFFAYLRCDQRSVFAKKEVKLADNTLHCGWPLETPAVFAEGADSFWHTLARLIQRPPATDSPPTTPRPDYLDVEIQLIHVEASEESDEHNRYVVQERHCDVYLAGDYTTAAGLGYFAGTRVGVLTMRHRAFTLGCAGYPIGRPIKTPSVRCTLTINGTTDDFTDSKPHMACVIDSRVSSKEPYRYEPRVSRAISRAALKLLDPLR